MIEYLTSMTEFEVGILWTIILLLMVFAGVRVFIAAAIVGLFGTVHIIGWKAGGANRNGSALKIRKLCSECLTDVYLDRLCSLSRWSNTFVI